MKKPMIPGGLALLAAVFAACVLSSHADVIAWTNTAGGNWNAPANWNPNQVPASSDDVVITAGGDYLVTLDVDVSINSLTLGGTSGQQRLTGAGHALALAAASVVNTNGVISFMNNTFSSSGPLTVSGVVNWLGGGWVPGGGVTLTSGATLNIRNNLDLYGALTNQGAVYWQGGHVQIWNNGTTQTGVIWNQAGKLWNIQCDQQMLASYGGEQFHNAGLVLKTSGAGTTTIFEYLDNTGTVQAQSGTIQLNGNSNLGGRFVAAANAGFSLAGNYTNGPAVSLTGAGTFALIGGSLTLQTNLIPNLALAGGTVTLDPTFQGGAITNLTLNGATLDATNTLIGDLTLNSGTLNGALTVLSGGVLNATNTTLAGPVTVGGNGVFNFAGGSLSAGGSITVGAGGTWNILGTLYLYAAVTNQGTVNWQTGYVYMYNNGGTQTGTMWNQVNGVWNISVNAGYSILAGDGPEQFHNAGLLRQTAGIVTAYLQVFLDNSGTVEVQGGTLLLIGGGNLGGSFLADAGAIMDFGGLNNTNSTVVNLSGAGILQLNSGTLTLLTNPIPNLQLTGGTVLLDPSFQGGTITNLTLNGATLGGTNTVSGTLTLSNSAVGGMLTVLAGGVCGWAGGSLAGTGSLEIATNGILNIEGTISVFGPMTNQGTVNMQAGYLQLLYGSGNLGQIWNQAGGVWNVQCDQGINAWTGQEQFNNAGVFRKYASFGVSPINVYFQNSGTVEAQSGTIQLNGGSNLGGTFLADAGAVMGFGGLNYTNSTALSLSGTGTFQFNSGILTLLTNPIPNLQLTGGTVLLDPSFQGGTITNLTLNGATLGGTNTVRGRLALNNSTVGGMLTVLAGSVCDWAGGSIAATGSLDIVPNGVLNIEGNIYAYGPITNQGTVNWQAGYLQLYYGGGYLGQIWNQAGGVWNLQCDQPINAWTGQEQFNNAGVLRKFGTFGASVINVYLQNSGTVEAQSGTIQLNGGSNLGGNFIADAGAIVGLGGATITNTVNPALNFSGAGTFQFGGGTLVLLTNTIPNLKLTGGTVLLDPSFQGGTITNLTLNGAALGGTNLVVSGNLTFNSGSLTGMVTVLSGATLTATNLSLLAATAVNANGVFIWAGGTLSPGASLTIAPGGTLNADGSGLLDLQSTVTNGGTVNWESGNIRLYNSSGLPSGSDVWNQPGAVWNALCDAEIYYVAGTEEFHNAGAFRKSVGLGATTIEMLFDNLGLVDAQSGRININPSGEAFTLEPDGALNFGINGLLDYGQITLLGNSPLNGAVSANFNNGYVPDVGDSFTPLSFGAAETGVFTGLNLPSNVSWQTNYSSTLFTLTVMQGLEMTPIAIQFVRGSTPFTLTAAVADSEVPPDSLTYSLVSPPGGMSIDPNTGVISWTPPNSASTNIIVVNVTDNGAPALHASTSFPLIVVPSHANIAPVLSVIPTTNIAEQALASIACAATEADPYATLAYSLVSAPAGAAIDANGIVTWTPAQTQSPSTNVFVVGVTNTDPYATGNQQLGTTGSFTVIVHEVNIAPLLPVILTQTINELSPLSVPNAATEVNIHATLSYSLVNPPAGMTINSSGLITWTPSQAQSPATNLIVTVVTGADAFDTVNPHLTATNQFAVVVKEVNVAPVLAAVPTQNANELALLTVNNPATDSNIHATLSYRLLNPPAGAAVSSSGVITWTPAQTQSPGSYIITNVATATDPYDLVNPSLSATNTFIVNVKEVNVAPVLSAIPAQTVNELTLLSVTNAATNSNIHATLSYSLLNPPVGMAVDANGVITWTPTQAQSPSTNVITNVATAADAFDTVNPRLSVTNTFVVVVKEVNVAPVLPSIVNTNINELTLLTVTNTAIETDIHATLAYSLVNPPAGMAIDANGVITWTPDQTQSPGTNLITTVVTNTDAFDSLNPHYYATNSFTVVVTEVNTAPVLPVIAASNVNELTLLTVTNTASESNIHATLSYSLLNPPAGAAIDANGVITWMPTQAQSPSNAVITTVVRNTDPLDAVNRHLSATNSFTVNVKEVNVAPVLPVVAAQTVNELTRLTVINTAAESNIHAALSYSLVNPPAGMAIDANGVITWTPSQAQSPSSAVITTIATSADAFDTVNPLLTATNAFTVTVREVNLAPVLPVIPDTNINELTLLTVTNTATDSNIHATLSYGLIGTPAGAAIDTNGIFTWTPAQTESPSTNLITVVAISGDHLDGADTLVAATNSFTVIVHEVNVPPFLPNLPPQTVNDLALLTVTNTAVESNIHASLTYALVNPPAGMAISPRGIVTWTPGPAQAPATNLITTIVFNTNHLDPLHPGYNATNTFLVIVYAPVLAPIPNATVNPGQTVAFTASATDNDPTQTLTYSLAAAPATASIDPGTGHFHWRPGVADANTTNTIVIHVSDNSVPPLTAAQSFNVTVNALSSPVNMAAITITPTQAQIQITGPTGPDYILLSSTNLVPGGWTPLLTNTPSVSPFTMTDTNAGLFTNQFYLIQLNP